MLFFVVAVFKYLWLVQKRFEMLPHTLKIYKPCVPFLLERYWSQNLELCNFWGQFVRETRSRRASRSSLLFSRPRLPEKGNRVMNCTEPSYVTSKPPFNLHIFNILLKLNFFGIWLGCFSPGTESLGILYKDGILVPNTFLTYLIYIDY